MSRLSESDRRLLQYIRSPEFRRYLQDLLLEICRVDTTPDPDIGVMAARERAVFEILERELAAAHFPDSVLERRPINPEICRRPAYSQLHYTKTPERPEGCSPQEAYADRFNLLLLADGGGQRDQGWGLAINAHIDVVAPYSPPRLENGVIFGRGSCDDKGGIVAMAGALKALANHLSDRGVSLNRHVTAMFVIEEETGGNGSLSLALDRELKQRYDSMIVLECCDLRIYPANRGAVWYRLDVVMPGVSQFEMAAWVIEQLEKEGRAIRAESRHPLFPQRPVQTCHAIIDHVGEHPSRICGEVAFRVDFAAPPDERTAMLVRDCVDFGLAEYIGLYGDKTKAIDAATGRPKVDHHYDLRRDGDGFLIEVHGATGHMGAILENDGAITKMAAMVRALAGSRAKLAELAGSTPTIELAQRRNRELLQLEGGQGFVPTHSIEDVMRRLIRAAQRGAEAYLSLIDRPGSGCDAVRGSFDKLHNAAYDGDPNSLAMQQALAVARECGMPAADEPVIGWTVSCDARLFAAEYPGLPVLTTGAGKLEYAHSDQEQICLDELVKSVEFLALYILRATGTE